MLGNSSNFMNLILHSLLQSLVVAIFFCEIEVHLRVAEHLRYKEILVGLVF